MIVQQDIITEVLPLVSDALRGQDAGAVTFQFGSDRVIVAQALLTNGQPIDPMAAHDTLTRLVQRFTTAGWTNHTCRDEEEDEITRASFYRPAPVEEIPGTWCDGYDTNGDKCGKSMHHKGQCAH